MQRGRQGSLRLYVCDRFAEVNFHPYASVVRSIATKVGRPSVAQHNSLDSFINYSRLHNLDVQSTVYQGTLYEYTVLKALQQLAAFDLYRTGGADDKGIDLAGTWTLEFKKPARFKVAQASLRDQEVVQEKQESQHEAVLAMAQGEVKRLRVVVQCKNESRKIGPRFIRELCGITRCHNTLLLMASSQMYTAKAVQAFMRTERPLCLVLIDTFDRGGQVRQLIWNASANDLLQGLAVRAIHQGTNIVIKLTYGDTTLTPSRNSCS